MLKMENVNAGYGDLQVLFNISLHVEEGECVALVGSNGAGKTTLLSVISGFTPIRSGKVLWYEEDLMKTPANKKADLGIAHIPQGRGILGTMTVMDNLLLAGHCKRVKSRRMENIEHMFEVFPKLRERQKQIAGSLSGGEQQMLAIARSMVMEPKLLILDEPSLGLAPIVVKEVFDIIRKIQGEGVSILIIEQNLMAALSVAKRGYVMETGHIVLEGSAADLMHNEDVKRTYLGL